MWTQLLDGVMDCMMMILFTVLCAEVTWIIWR